MKKKLDLKMLENSDMKTLEALSYKYRAVDDDEAEKIYRRISNNTEDYYEEVQVYKVENYHRPIWRKMCSAVLTLATVVLTVWGGSQYYAHLKNNRMTDNNIASDTTSCGTENKSTAIAITDDYKGQILGIQNWHIEKFTAADGSSFKSLTFINDDTGEGFADCIIFKDEVFAYLSDLDNDGEPELILNCAYGIVSGDNTYYTKVYRINNGIIECGIANDDIRAYLDENRINTSSNLDVTEKYYPDRNKIIVTNRNDDKEFEMSMDNFKFYHYEQYPVKVDDNYKGPIFGTMKWIIGAHSISDDTEYTYLLFTRTGFGGRLFDGYKDRTSIYLTDLDMDGIPELICNYQYGEDESEWKDHVIIYRVNVNGEIEQGTFLDDFEAFEKAHNIELNSCDDFTETFIPERNKIILKKQGSDTEYELGIEYYHFEVEE
ncbi:hypothetical protein [Ruminococcus sp.]|uniref:hypothetical protein n=1 Tax=Ruminococcus sp. TaxID=41978 RepID=UPI0025EE22BB|nr:hypothetical protein [Ruminococcus sp.]